MDFNNVSAVSPEFSRSVQGDLKCRQEMARFYSFMTRFRCKRPLLVCCGGQITRWEGRGAGVKGRELLQGKTRPEKTGLNTKRDRIFPTLEVKQLQSPGAGCGFTCEAGTSGGPCQTKRGGKAGDEG